MTSIIRLVQIGVDQLVSQGRWAALERFLCVSAANDR
jgi:hypothetical protein